MSQYEVDAVMQAVEYADDLESVAPYSRMTIAQINRRYAQWIVEYLHEAGFRITRLAMEA